MRGRKSLPFHRKRLGLVATGADGSQNATAEVEAKGESSGMPTWLLAIAGMLVLSPGGFLFR